MQQILNTGDVPCDVSTHAYIQHQQYCTGLQRRWMDGQMDMDDPSFLRFFHPKAQANNAMQRNGKNETGRQNARWPATACHAWWRVGQEMKLPGR